MPWMRLVRYLIQLVLELLLSTVTVETDSTGRAKNHTCSWTMCVIILFVTAISSGRSCQCFPVVCFTVCVCYLTAMGVLGAVRLRKDRRCWLRSENLRMDSLLREARERRELVLLKSPVPSSPLPPLSTELDKKVSAPWRERRTFPTHPVTCDWATVSLSPRYSITTRYWQDSLWTCLWLLLLSQQQGIIRV